MTQAPSIARVSTPTVPAKNESAWKFFAALTVVYLCVRIPWTLSLPVWEAPDEANHFWVVHFLMEHLRLPTASEVAAAGPPAEYASLPQLGYIPNVIAALCSPETLTPLFSRFGGMVAGLVTLWTSVKVGTLLFPSNRLAALALPWSIVFHPQLVFVNSYTNTDSMATAVSSLIVLMLVSSFKGGVKGGISISRASAIGALFGLLALCKHTGLSLAPAILFGVVMCCYSNSMSLLQMVSRVMALLFAAFAASGWWFVRNYSEFSGDWLGTRTMYDSWKTVLQSDSNGVIKHPWPELTKMAYWRFMFFDYCGLFGYMDRYLWRPVYMIYLAFWGASTLGTIIAFRTQQRVAVKQWVKNNAVWLMLIAFPICNFLANVVATSMNVTGPHGRYLFPSEIPILACIIAGLAALGHRIGSASIVALIALNAVVTIGAWCAFYMPR